MSYTQSVSQGLPCTRLTNKSAMARWMRRRVTLDWMRRYLRRRMLLSSGGGEAFVKLSRCQHSEQNFKAVSGATWCGDAENWEFVARSFWWRIGLLPWERWGWRRRRRGRGRRSRRWRSPSPSWSACRPAALNAKEEGRKEGRVGPSFNSLSIEWWPHYS